ncbi:MAG: EAL domain-containing protein [Gammaproteobacteria bacterium]|nr:EAL domain-containing protein [Gammaproteobacteria bacterium]
MKLRNKAILSIGLVWATFLILTYIGSHTLILQTFLKAENDRAEQDLTRVDATLNQLSNELNTFTSDWSHWNDAYRFMQGENPDFVSSNLNMTAYVNANVNLLTYWNKENKLVAGAAVDLEDKKIIPYPAELKKYIYPGSPLLDTQITNKPVQGYMLVDDIIMLVSASPVTDGKRKLPPLGTLITATSLTDKLIEKIANISKLQLALFTSNQINSKPNLIKAWNHTLNSPDHHFQYTGNNITLRCYTMIFDINNNPIGIIQLKTTRNIFLAGNNTIHYFLVIFISLGIVFSLFMTWLLNILIIKRLEKLDKEIATIENNNEFSKRVEVEGSDELSSVANQVNFMLANIQSSQELLERRVNDRTLELQESNTQLKNEITERKAIEIELTSNKKHLVHVAHHDKLTNLPNRNYFNETINKILGQSERSGQVLAILFIDLDRFKKINDAFGHTIGDLVLQEVAKRFTSVLRKNDFISRLGGDEFIILLNEIKRAKFASPVAEKILQVCKQPIKIGVHKFFISASIGISIYPNDGSTLEDLQRHADMAMYKAKKNGGDAFHYFTREMNTEAHEYIRLETALRRAITNKEFVFHFQPQFDLKTGKIVGVEALIRWNDPEIGLVSPDKFIPLAEETGLILIIGEWTLEEACKINKSWQDQGYEPITIAVNISAKQFQHQDLTEIISRVLTETKLEAKYLEIEITETSVMENIDVTIKKLNEIKSMGVNISIDDFGIGYTSISYLKKFPISLIKIDQSFMRGIPDNANDSAIISAIIALGHNLEIKVLAEGVETKAQHEYLINRNCDLVQGYLLSRPQPENEVVLQFKKI